MASAVRRAEDSQSITANCRGLESVSNRLNFALVCPKRVYP